MTWWSWLRSDLARPETPIDRKELPLLTAGAVLIVVIAWASDPGTAPELLLVVLAAGTLVLRGVVSWLPWEVVAVVVSLALVVTVSQEGNLEVAFFLCVLVTLYGSWHLNSLARALLVTAISAAAPIVVSLAIPHEDIEWIPWVAANLLTFVLGRNLRRQRVLIEQLEAARGALADRAVAEERQRIARDLHDLTGHTIAAVLLHVTGARHVLRRDIDEADRALIQAETIGRSSLDQIRTTVAALRTSERGTDAALPGSADLIALVEEYRHAGLDVTAVIAPPIADIEGPLGTALHRISREALANVARHAPGNRVELTVALEAPGGPVRLVVADHGRAAVAPTRDDGHFGLVGMRERARALGGELGRGPHRRRLAGRGAAAVLGARPPVIRLLIVDDQPVVRAGVARILGPDDGFELVAECDDGDEVAAAVAAHRPDLVLMDVRMRRVDGVTATRSLGDAGERAAGPDVHDLRRRRRAVGCSRRGRGGVHPERQLGRGPHRCGAAPWPPAPPGSTPRWHRGSWRLFAPTCGRTWPRRPGSRS